MKEGQLNNMWRVNIEGMQKLLDDPQYTLQWELVTPSGKGPGKISHHTCAAIGEQMILIGGLQGDNSNSNLYSYDIAKNAWSILNN